MGMLLNLLSALLKIAAIMFLLAGAAVASIWLYKFSGVFPRVVYLSCSATDEEGTTRPIPYAFVIDEGFQWFHILGKAHISSFIKVRGALWISYDISHP